MSPRTRFAVWIVLVLGTLLGHVAWLTALGRAGGGDSTALLRGGVLAVSVLLAGFVALLATTPPDAIRLRRRTSNGVILVATVALVGAAVTSLGSGVDLHGWVAMAATLVSVALWLGLTTVERLSPWWAIIFTWHPLTTLAAAGRGGTTGEAVAGALAVGVIIALRSGQPHAAVALLTLAAAAAGS